MLSSPLEVGPAAAKSKHTNIHSKIVKYKKSYLLIQLALIAAPHSSPPVLDFIDWALNAFTRDLSSTAPH